MAKKNTVGKSNILLDKYEKLLADNFKQKDIIRSLRSDLEFYEIERASFLIEVNKYINKEIQFIGNLEDFSIDYAKMKSNNLAIKIIYSKDRKMKRFLVAIMSGMLSWQERLSQRFNK